LTGEKLRSIRRLTPIFGGKSDATRRNDLARKTVLVCDNCGSEVGEGKGATMRLNFSDARRGSKQADLCDNCAGGMPGQAVARRGRRPKSATV
jgi:ribosomal protein S26